MRQCILTGTTQRPTAAVKHQHEWVWAVQQSQIATRDTSEKQLLKSLTFPFSSAKEKSWGEKRNQYWSKKDK